MVMWEGVGPPVDTGRNGGRTQGGRATPPEQDLDWGGLVLVPLMVHAQGAHSGAQGEEGWSMARGAGQALIQR